MKKAVVLLSAGLFLLASFFAFSQQQANPKDAYVKTVHIVKIWVSSLGYKVTFVNSYQQLQDIYVPITWFNNGPTSKAELVWGNSTAYPYFSIFWVDGSFDHITLYVLFQLLLSHLGSPGDHS